MTWLLRLLGYLLFQCAYCAVQRWFKNLTAARTAGWKDTVVYGWACPDCAQKDEALRGT